jgi:uncharacterized protein YpiB (UPF0302 family)
MPYQKVKYTLITLLLVFIFSESCSTNSRGLFEKRKHLKGWHFHKKQSVSENSSKAPNEITFNKNDEDVLNLRYKKRYQNNVNSLEVRKSNLPYVFKVDKELMGFRSSTKNQPDKIQKYKEGERIESNKSFYEKGNERSFENIKKSSNQWQVNGAYFFLLMIFPLAFNNSKRKQVQVWAARNKGKSRTLLVIAKVLLAATSIGLGFLIGAPFSLPLLLLSVGLLVLSIGLSKYWNSNDKMTQKKNLGILGVVNTSTSFGFFSFGGMLANGFQFSQWSLSSGLLNFSSNNPENELVNHPVYIIIGMFLLVLIAGFLLVLIGWLSCSFYCGSSELVGILIFILGGSAVLFASSLLTFKLFERKNLSKEKKKKRLWWSALIALVAVVAFTLLWTLA